MSVFQGYKAFLDLGAVLDSDQAYNAYNWSINVGADDHDITAFGTTGWRKKASGLKNWSGSCEMYIDDTYRLVPSDVGAEVSGRFAFSDGTLWGGKCLIQNFQPTVNVEGIPVMTVSLMGSSDLSAL